MEITVRGVPVYYTQSGSGTRHILLLHGWGCTGELWQPVASSYARRGHVTVIDFPGHGKSGRPPVPWGTEDFADMTAELIEKLGLAPCDIVGHSHGGRVALMTALRRPDLVGRLVLTGSAGLRKPPDPKSTGRTRRYRALRGICDRLEKARIFGRLPARMREALVQRYGSPDYRALDEEMRRTFVRVVNTDLTGRLGEVKASTLLLWGELDTETPLWMGRRMESEIPDAGLVVLRGGSHFAHLEKLGEFLTVSEHFLFGGA